MVSEIAIVIVSASRPVVERPPQADARKGPALDGPLSWVPIGLPTGGELLAARTGAGASPRRGGRGRLVCRNCDRTGRHPTGVLRRWHRKRLG